LLLILALTGPVSSALERPASAGSSPSGRALSLGPCTSVAVSAPVPVVVGKSTVLRLDAPAVRLIVGGFTRGGSRAGRAGESEPARASAAAQAAPVAGAAVDGADGVADADVMLLSSTELFFMGKRTGSMNVVLQSADGQCTIRDLVVTVDPSPLRAQFDTLLPGETGLRVQALENSLVLSGRVSDASRLDQAMTLATAFGEGRRVINLLQVNAPQQVMLEVKIAEVSKTLIDKLGASTALGRSASAANGVSLLSSFASGGAGLLEAIRVGKAIVDIDGQKEDGLVRILAEPNIMAISGQSASFLSGGKIFIPVPQAPGTGGTVITLDEKEFGIAVKFTPTALDARRINLKLVSEVSDLSQTGAPFSTVNGVVSVIPAFTVRRADTTVQLNDGQSFVIAGLIKNNGGETVKRFPGLGEIPILGALFRSVEYQKEQTELMFVVTPRLVRPLADVPVLPTDNHVPPSRAEVYLDGALEGRGREPGAPWPAPDPAPGAPIAPAPASPAKVPSTPEPRLPDAAGLADRPAVPDPADRPSEGR
jgi:pilus assembly protein CpaC